MKIDIGCGKNKKHGYIGIDKIATGDIIANIEYGLPIKSDSVKTIYCSHVIEHLGDPLKIFLEMYRVLITKGIAEIIVPHFSNIGAFHPLHKTFWNVRGFDFLDKEHKHHFYLTQVNFTVIKKIEFRYLKFMEIINIRPKIQRLYEQYLSSIFRAYQIKVILQKQKL